MKSFALLNEAIKSALYTAKPCLYRIVEVRGCLGGLHPRGALLGNLMSNVYVRSGPPRPPTNHRTHLPFQSVSVTLLRRSDDANVWRFSM